MVEALDWGCQLRISQTLTKPAAHIGIRAHHIDFVESRGSGATEENVVPCWLVRSSETPFRITLYLRLHRPPEGPGEQSSQVDLQAEVFKEKWERFREHPLPWHVRLSPDSLFVLPE